MGKQKGRERATNLIRASKEIWPPWDALGGVKVILGYY